MQVKNLTYRVNFLMNPDDYTNMKKILKDEEKQVGSFIRLAISNELESLNTYIKEKNQTWDLD